MPRLLVFYTARQFSLRLCEKYCFFILSATALEDIQKTDLLRSPPNPPPDSITSFSRRNRGSCCTVCRPATKDGVPPQQ